MTDRFNISLESYEDSDCDLDLCDTESSLDKQSTPVTVSQSGTAVSSAGLVPSSTYSSTPKKGIGPPHLDIEADRAATSKPKPDTFVDLTESPGPSNHTAANGAAADCDSDGSDQADRGDERSLVSSNVMKDLDYDSDSTSGSDVQLESSPKSPTQPGHSGLSGEREGDLHSRMTVTEIKIAIGCDCNNNCFSRISVQDILTHVDKLKKMGKREKECCIMGALQEIGSDNKRSRYGERQRRRYEYRFDRHNICKKAFTIIYDIGEGALKALIKHRNEKGNVPRQHGNTGRKPKNYLHNNDIEKAAKFIIDYSVRHGVLHPVCRQGCDKGAPLYLPASMTKRVVHGVYVQHCADTDSRVIKYRSFTGIWNQCCSRIKVASPKEDIGERCEKCGMTRKAAADTRANETVRASRVLQKHKLSAKIKQKDSGSSFSDSGWEECDTEADRHNTQKVVISDDDERTVPGSSTDCKASSGPKSSREPAAGLNQDSSSSKVHLAREISLEPYPESDGEQSVSPDSPAAVKKQLSTRSYTGALNVTDSVGASSTGTDIPGGSRHRKTTDRCVVEGLAQGNSKRPYSTTDLRQGHSTDPYAVRKSVQRNSTLPDPVDLDWEKSVGRRSYKDSSVVKDSLRRHYKSPPHVKDSVPSDNSHSAATRGVGKRKYQEIFGVQERESRTSPGSCPVSEAMDITALSSSHDTMPTGPASSTAPKAPGHPPEPVTSIAATAPSCPPEPKPFLQCEACHSEVAMNSIVRCCGYHNICVKCVEKAAKSVLSGEVKGHVICLVEHCTRSIPKSELECALQSIVMELLEEKWSKEALEAIKDMDDVYECPLCGYAMVVDPDVKQFRCQKCNKVTCRFCQKDWESLQHSLCMKTQSQGDGPNPAQVQVPAHWTEITDRSKPFQEFQVDRSSTEFVELAASFYSTMKQQGTEITNIYRIQNERLWQKYSLMRTHMVEDLGEMHINERRLFHGTSINLVAAICFEGFDWRLSGKHGTAYGQGSYFARDAAYSVTYCKGKKSSSLGSAFGVQGNYNPGPQGFGFGASMAPQPQPPSATPQFVPTWPVPHPQQQTVPVPGTVPNLFGSQPNQQQQSQTGFPLPGHQQPRTNTFVRVQGANAGFNLPSSNANMGAGPAFGNTNTAGSIFVNITNRPSSAGSVFRFGNATYTATGSVFGSTSSSSSGPSFGTTSSSGGTTRPGFSASFATSQPATSTPTADGTFLMFVGRVLVGRTCPGRHDMRRPPKDETDPLRRQCHTAVNHVNNPSIFVIFDSSQCYPEYLIQFRQKTR